MYGCSCAVTATDTLAPPNHFLFDAPLLSLLSLLQGGYEFMTSMITDVDATKWWILICGGLVPLVLGFVYIAFLRICICPLVYFIEVLLIVLFFIAGAYSLFKVRKLKRRRTERV
jgi:hypothetical protein